MKKEKAQVYIEENLNKGDTLIGFFQATKWPNFWLLVILGPLFAVTMKMYFLAVTEQGLYFHRLGLFGGIKDAHFIRFNEIASVSIGEGILQRPIHFSLKNGKKIKVRAQINGAERIAKLSPEVQQHLVKNITVTI